MKKKRIDLEPCFRTVEAHASEYFSPNGILAELIKSTLQIPGLEQLQRDVDYVATMVRFQKRTNSICANIVNHPAVRHLKNVRWVDKASGT
jgi:hypothetical protein